MDTMLDNSGALAIAPAEYLTVAARRDTPPSPLNDVRTVTFSILGADLDAYHQKQLSSADARKRIRVDEVLEALCRGTEEPDHLGWNQLGVPVS